MKRKVWLGITLACSLLFAGGVLLSASDSIDTKSIAPVAQNEPPAPWTLAMPVTS
ncbi:MAG: hypothetical protein WCC10_02020 [Tumebacillaceae bacterium]